MSRITKQIQIDNLKAAVETERACVREVQRENETLQKLLDAKSKRLADIAAENESLRSDKTWLKQMHSGLLQSIPEMFRSRNALSR